MVLLWGNVMFGASTVAVFASKDFCDAALTAAVADMQAQHLTAFSARCEIQSRPQEEKR
jgi:hypothetical protein